MRTVESYRRVFRWRSSARPTRPPSPTESHRGVQVLFVAVVAMVAVVGSERMYWYWETSFVEHLAAPAPDQGWGHMGPPGSVPVMSISASIRVAV